MIYERFEQLSDGTILRHREVQTELAECWVRRVKERGVRRRMARAQLPWWRLWSSIQEHAVILTPARR